MKKAIILTAAAFLLLTIPGMTLAGGRYCRPRRHCRPYYHRGYNKAATALALIALVDYMRRSCEKPRDDCYQPYPGAQVVCQPRPTYYNPPPYPYPCR